MKIPRTIIDDLKFGRLVFFLGSGISIGTHDKQGFPSGNDLCKALSNNFLGIDPEPNESLTEVAQKIVWKNNNCRQQVEAYLLNLFNNPKIRPLPSHLALSKLNCSMITTNYDQLIEQAFKINGKRLSVIIDDKDLININHQGNILIKIHGCISKIDKCIILEEDYYNWMNSSTESKNLIRAWFMMNQIVFVGYSLNDINFRQLIVELRRKFGTSFRNCYFVNPFIEEESYNYKYLKNVIGVQFVKMEASSFFDQLVLESNTSSIKYSESELNDDYFSSIHNQIKSFQDYAAKRILEEIKKNSAVKMELDSIILSKIFTLAQENPINYSETYDDIEISSEMAFIPKGEFIMGGSRLGNEMIRIEYIDYNYLIDKYLVTNKDYRVFIEWIKNNPGNSKFFHPDQPIEKNNLPHFDFSGKDAKDVNIAGLPDDYFTNPEYDDFPVVNIDWWDAYAYALWAGKRLPSEKEWEKAARGIDGRIYPYGNDFDPKKCNVSESGIFHPTHIKAYEEGKSPYGVYDMCGNVWEWCVDLFENFSNIRNATRVVKGGSCTRGKVKASSAFRNGRYPDEKWISRGFRCVKDINI